MEQKEEEVGYEEPGHQTNPVPIWLSILWIMFFLWAVVYWVLYTFPDLISWFTRSFTK